MAPCGGSPKAPVAGFAWWRQARCGTPLTRFVAPYGFPSKAQVAGFAWRHRAFRHMFRGWAPLEAPSKAPVAGFACHVGVTPVSAHSSHVCGRFESSTKGPSGRVRMLALRPFWHTPHKSRAPVWELHRSCYSQLRYSQLHIFGSSAKIRLSPLQNQHFLCPGPLGAPRCPLELLQDCLREPNSITGRLQEGPRRVLRVLILSIAQHKHVQCPLGVLLEPPEALLSSSKIV